MSTLRMILAFFMLLPQILAPVPAMLQQSKYFEDWSAQQEYTEDYAVTVQKDPNKDFVILNLTDIQLKDDEYYAGEGAASEAMITRLVEEQKPDLITLTGDNAWATLSYLNLVEFMDSFGIPWAPVMGNHDGQNCFNEFWCAYLFSEAENCLWKFGPKDMGYGNYVINIEENGEVIHSLFMMDTHSKVDEKDKYGMNYDHLWDNQIEWYKWAVKGIEKTVGHKVESSAFMHIPVYEVQTVWEEYYDKENDVFTGPYADTSFGIVHEIPAPGVSNNGFMDEVIALGSTKNIIFGHDHINNASILYEGVRLTYSMKLGKGCYFEEGLQGGTTLTVDSTGKGTINHINYGA